MRWVRRFLAWRRARREAWQAQMYLWQQEEDALYKQFGSCPASGDACLGPDHSACNMRCNWR